MRTMIIVMAGALCVACGAGEYEVASAGEAVIGSCNAIASLGVCEEYRGPIPQQALDARGARCMQAGGTLSNAPCPLDGMLGSCLAIAPAEAGSVPGTSVFGGAYRPEAILLAQGQCAQAGGTWTPYQ